MALAEGWAGPVPASLFQAIVAAVRPEYARPDLAVLEFLSVSPRPATLADIQRRLQYPMSSLLVLLRTLVAVGWVHLDERSGCYSLGLRALMSGSAYLESDTTAQFASIILRPLSEQPTTT